MKANNPHYSSRVMLMLGAAFFLFSGISLFGQKTEFTGTWNLNQGKSQLGEGPGRRAATKLVITQDATGLNVERTSTRQNGETMTFSEKYTFDGKPSDNSNGNRQKSSTASWSSNNQELTINSVTSFERDGNTMEMKSTEVYKLSADKQTLTIETSGSSPRGEYKTSLVYDLAK